MPAIIIGKWGSCVSTSVSPPPAVKDEAQYAELKELACRFAERELRLRATDLDKDVGDAREVAWRGCAELGVDRAVVAEDLGGAGLDPVTFFAILEELARGDGGIAAALLLHNAAMAALASKASATESNLPPNGERWVCMPPPAMGSLLAEGALPAAGASSLGARRKNGGLVLDGRLPFVLGAAGAAGAVIMTRADDQSLVAAALRLDGEGIEVVPDTDQMGLRATPAAEIRFTGLGVQEPDLLIDDVSGLASRTRTLILGGVAAVACGIARFAEEQARAYADERRQGGVLIAEHDAVALMLAGMIARRQSLDRSAFSDPVRALAAKIATTEAALATAIDAVQVFGGTGYMTEAGVEKAMRDAKYCQLYPEPNLLERLVLFKLERR